MSKSNQNLVTLFLEALASDVACLHPTDSLPGLTFNPHKDAGLKSLLKFKGRDACKSFIALLPSLERALYYWLPLPGVWEEVLKKLWPAPLSVIWLANKNTPSVLIHQDQSCSFRVPRLDPRDGWLHFVLEKIDYPLPTTSVNRTGEPAKATWKEAVAILKPEQDFYLPAYPVADLQDLNTKSKGLASTLIKIQESGDYQLLREGLISREVIDRALNKEL